MPRQVLAIFIGLLITAGILGGVWFKLSQGKAAAGAQDTINLAESQARDGQWQQAIQTATPLADAAPTLELRQRVWMLLAEAHTAAQASLEATRMYQRLADEARDPSLRGRALYELALRALAAGQVDVAEGHFNRLGEIGAADFTEHRLYGQGRIAEARGDAEAARALYRQARQADPLSPIVNEIEDRLSGLNLDVLFSLTLEGDDELYVIQRGDTLDRLGRRFGVSASLIERVNNLNPRNLQINRRIKIPRRDFRVEIYKDDFTLLVFNGDEFYARYPIRVGREEYMTPLGEFHIEARSVNPAWNDPVTGRNVAPGAPDNELGTRWMGFREMPSIGIHGTIQPDTIGTRASNGCIGLRNSDVEELFDLLPRGTEVTIYQSRVAAEAARTARTPPPPAPATASPESMPGAPANG
ncbi:MAG: tetratricopeptide repeat protein [Candidatus Sumerlaeia bacterium]|nr:tetratricopeptide repeat protein [Candidatus Sumerlaeia bacterium]